MSADSQDLINHLMIQAAQPAQPSFAGLSAPQDPQAIQALIAKLQQQQYLQQVNRPTPGEWGYLHDAGKEAFTRVGQGIGNLVFGQPAAQQAPQGPAFTMPSPGSATADQNAAAQMPDAPSPTQGTDPNTPQTSPQSGAPPAPIPNQGATPQQSARNMILAGQAYNQALIKRGIPADQAKVQTLTQMVQWGTPGAEDELARAQTALIANQHVQGETTHNLAQSRAADANILNQQDEQKGRAKTQDFEQQRINIELSRLGIERNKAQQAADGPDLLAPASPGEQIIAQKMADGDMKLPDPGSRGKNAARYAALALQINPDLTQELYGTRQKALTAITSGPQGNQVRSFNVGYNHLDTVNQAVDALQNNDLKAFNNIANRFQTQTGGANATRLDTALAMVKGELAKAIIGTHPPEGMVNQMLAGVSSASSPDQLRIAADTAKDLMLGQASGVKQQFGKSILGAHFNFDDALSPGFKRDLAAYESKREAGSSGQRPQGTQGAGAPANGTAPPAQNAQGWVLHTDKFGKQAYLSPDGKQFQIVGAR